MEKVSRAISHNFLSELNNKHLIEIKDFFDYAKNFYEDLVIVEKFYKTIFNELSPLSINRYLIMFDNAYNKLIEQIFGEINIDNSNYNNRHGRFDIDNLIKLSNTKNNKKNFKYYLFDQTEFETIKTFANKIFNLELKCSKYTKKIWSLTNSIDIKNGLFVKVITQENWRNKKLTPSLKKYYNSRIGMSVSYINDQKSKFFKDTELDVLAGIVYMPNKIICGNYFDSYTSEFINDYNPVDNLSFKFYSINKVYSEVKKDAKHDIYAFGTLTATPISVLSCDDCHNEVIVDKKSAKPLAVFYVNDQSIDYANALAKKHKLPVIKIKNLNKLNVHNIKQTKHILEEKIHL